MKIFTLTGKTLLCLLLLLSAKSIEAQNNAKEKIPLDHSVYDSWKSINSLTITDDGKFATFIVKEQEGDNSLILINVKSREQRLFPRGNDALFTSDGKYLAFSIKPTFAQIRSAKIDKKKGTKAPNDTLGLYCIATQKLV